jgi:hypothetical protein
MSHSSPVGVRGSRVWMVGVEAMSDTNLVKMSSTLSQSCRWGECGGGGWAGEGEGEGGWAAAAGLARGCAAGRCAVLQSAEGRQRGGRQAHLGHEGGEDLIGDGLGVAGGGQTAEAKGLCRGRAAERRPGEEEVLAAALGGWPGCTGRVASAGACAGGRLLCARAAGRSAGPGSFRAAVPPAPAARLLQHHCCAGQAPACWPASAERAARGICAPAPLRRCQAPGGSLCTANWGLRLKYWMPLAPTSTSLTFRPMAVSSR